MKKLILTLTTIIAMAVVLSANQSLGQSGNAASGRSTSGSLKLDSIYGQSFSGVAGNLTSGFYAQQNVPAFIAGDADGNGTVTISDVVFLINYIFAGTQAPPNPASADTDCSGRITISDVVYLLNFIFSGGPGPHYCK